MTAEELRAIKAWLQQRVSLESRDPVAVAFAEPTAAEMAAAGLNPEGAKRLREMPWWGEMAADIRETPELCDPEDPPAEVLALARDVVNEYISKRFPLEP